MHTNHPSLAAGQNITLENIAGRKAELRKEIDEQKTCMATSAKAIFAPLLPDPSSNPLMRSFNTGMAIFDGVMIGFKIMKSIRKLFLKR